MNLDVLMERLRVQSLIQRLRRQYGDQQAWAIVQAAFEIELRVPDKQPRKKPLFVPVAK